MVPPTFDQWINLIFDCSTDDPITPLNAAPISVECTPELTVQYLTRLFQKSGEALQSCSDSQVNSGLWHIGSNASSDYMLALLDKSVPWPERQQAVRAMYTLFERCFAVRCLPGLSHLGECLSNPLNSVCYMWFDIIPIYGDPGKPDRSDVDGEMLALLRRIVRLDSEPCQESALHGLGHWQVHYPHVVQATIDEFLQRTPHLRRELRHYAAAARRGVLQ